MQIKEQKFKELFLTESGRMYKAAYILLGDEDEAKDVVQDVFAKLWAGTILMPEAITTEKYDDEIIEMVNRYVDEKLSPQTSRIIKMHFDEDQSYKDISSSLGISLSAVNKHIVQGLRKLRSTFKDREA